MAGRKYLTHLEIEKLVAATAVGKNAVRDKCMLLMCFIHGLRVSEWRIQLLSATLSRMS